MNHQDLIRKFLFGCHEHIESIHTFSVNVALPDQATMPATDNAREAAVKKAAEVARSKGLSAPVLLQEAGVPDLRIILEGGEIAGVFVRNTEIAPAISVTDLDYARDPVQEAQKLSLKLQEAGYTRIPHMLDL